MNLVRDTPGTRLRMAAGAVTRADAQALLDDLPRDEPAVCLARLLLLDDEVAACRHKTEVYMRGRYRPRKRTA